MAEPCQQEKTIGELQATMEAVSETLKEMRTGQQRFIAILEDIARQGEQIRSLLQRTGKSEKDITNLFDRMRDVEMLPGKKASAFQTYGFMALIAAAIGFLFKKFGG